MSCNLRNNPHCVVAKPRSESRRPTDVTMASRTCRQLFRNYLSFVSRNRAQFRKVKIPGDGIQRSNNLQAFNWNKFRLTLQYIASKVKLKHVVGTNVVFCAVALCYNGSKNGKKKDALNVSFKVNIFYQENLRWCYILQRLHHHHHQDCLLNTWHICTDILKYNVMKSWHLY